MLPSPRARVPLGPLLFPALRTARVRQARQFVPEKQVGAGSDATNGEVDVTDDSTTKGGVDVNDDSTGAWAKGIKGEAAMRRNALWYTATFSSEMIVPRRALATEISIAEGRSGSAAPPLPESG